MQKNVFNKGIFTQKLAFRLSKRTEVYSFGSIRLPIKGQCGMRRGGRRRPCDYGAKLFFRGFPGHYKASEV
jgi:hypothetical protein